MNWKIIFQLSIFGLIMAFGTISLIPEQFEFIFWLCIFAFCAYVIVKTCSGRYFLHGVCVSLVNSIWITGVHMLFYETYVTHHPGFYGASQKMTLLLAHPKVKMLIMGPFFGIAFGLILGLFCFIASRIFTRKPAA